MSKTKKIIKVILLLTIVNQQLSICKVRGSLECNFAFGQHISCLKLHLVRITYYDKKVITISIPFLDNLGHNRPIVRSRWSMESKQQSTQGHV